MIRQPPTVRTQRPSLTWVCECERVARIGRGGDCVGVRSLTLALMVVAAPQRACCGGAIPVFHTREKCRR